MMTKDEALKIRQILDNPDLSNNERMWEVSLLIDEALEQPTVAELNDEYLRDTYVEGLNQPAWQGLTDDEIQSITWQIWGADALEPELDYARAIEQALKDKNT